MSRDEIYMRLSKLVGNTPLYEIKNINIPNKCRIFCKEENLNPTGSHYDRFWVHYMKWYEKNRQKGHLNPLFPIIETSTGNSGASFAWVCRVLGFNDYRVVIPEDMPYARKKQIESYGAKLICSPKEQYINGLIDTFRVYKDQEREKADKENKMIYIPNHSKNGAECLESMEKIAEEIITELSNNSIDKIDYFVSALGNGLSTKGVGVKLKECYPSIRIVGMEPEESPTIFLDINQNIKKPDTYGHTHGLIGTGPGNTNYVFPIIDSYKNKIDIFYQVKESDWKETSIKLADYEGKFVGHTSAACVNTALKIAENAKKNSIIVTIFYDSDWKYL